MKKRIVVIIILILIEIFCLIKIYNQRYNKEIRIEKKNIKISQNQNNIWEDKINITIEPEFNPIKKYPKEKLNVRKSKDGEIVDVLNINEEVLQLKELSGGWSLIKYKNNNRYVKSEYLANDPVKIAEAVPISQPQVQSLPRKSNWTF